MPSIKHILTIVLDDLISECCYMYNYILINIQDIVTNLNHIQWILSSLHKISSDMSTTGSCAKAHI
jgi:hypothetical protein